MTVYRRLTLLVLLLASSASIFVPIAVHAAETRPNALDRRVDAIPAAQLQQQPATALADADRQVAAARLARWMLPGWIASIVFQIVVLAYFWQSGAAAKLRDRFRRNLPSEFSVRFAFGASLALIARLAALIPAFYVFRVGRVMGISDVLIRSWSVTWLLNTLVAMFIAGVVVTLVLWLVDRTHQWYVYTMIAIIAGSFFVSYVQPFAGGPALDVEKPMPPSYMASLAPLETRAGVSVPILVDERQQRSHAGGVSIEGLGPTRRIVIADSIVAGVTPAELRFVVAYELGELSANDPVRVAAYNALLVIFGIALAVFVADRIGFRRDDDPVARLALVAALMGCMFFVMAPIDNLILRGMSWNADRYAIALTGDAVGATREIVRTTDQNLDEVCPSVGTRLFLESIPSASERIAAINGVPSGCP